LPITPNRHPQILALWARHQDQEQLC